MTWKRVAGLLLAGALAFAVYVWAEPYVLEPDLATTEAVVGAEMELVGYRSTTLAGDVRRLWKDVTRLPAEQVLPTPEEPPAQWNYTVDLPEGYRPPASFDCAVDGSEVLDCNAAANGLTYRLVVFQDDGWAAATVSRD